VESSNRQTKEIPSAAYLSIQQNNLAQQRQRKAGKEEKAALHPPILNISSAHSKPQVSRPQRQLTVPGATQNQFTQNVPPPPLHLHNLRPLLPLPETHNRMPARLDRTRPTPLHRLRHRLTPLPKLEAREALPTMPSPAGSTHEPNRSCANHQVR